MLDDDRIHEAMQELRAMLRADGADVELVGIDGGIVELRLSLDDVSCEECVVPAEILEQIALDVFRRKEPRVKKTRIDDPRANSLTNE